MLTRMEAPELAFAIDQARQQVRLMPDETHFDDDLTMLIGDVQSATESALRSGVTDTKYRETLSRFPVHKWYLGRGRVQSITSIKYFDSANTEQTLADIKLSEFGGLVLIEPKGDRFPAVAARLDAITVEYISGHGAPEQVPESIKRWMKLQLGNWFTNRESVGERALVSNPFIDGLISEYQIRTYI